MIRPLTASTPNDRVIEVRRSFRTPIERVWAAHTRPDLVKRWMSGPDGWTMSVCEIDLRVGGPYRFEWAHPDRPSFGSSGTYQLIEAPSRLVFTEKLDGMPGEAFNDLVLHEDGGVTTLIMTMTFNSTAARDMALKSGMTGGMESSYARLERVLANTLDPAD